MNVINLPLSVTLGDTVEYTDTLAGYSPEDYRLDYHFSNGNLIQGVTNGDGWEFTLKTDSTFANDGTFEVVRTVSAYMYVVTDFPKVLEITIDNASAPTGFNQLIYQVGGVDVINSFGTFDTAGTVWTNVNGVEDDVAPVVGAPAYSGGFVGVGPGSNNEIAEDLASILPVWWASLNRSFTVSVQENVLTITRSNLTDIEASTVTLSTSTGNWDTSFEITEIPDIVVPTITSASARTTIDRASVQVEVDPTNFPENYEARSKAVLTLEAIDAVLQGRASTDQSSYSIAGRSLAKTPIGELLELRNYYAILVNKQRKKELAGRGKAVLDGRRVTFGSPSSSNRTSPFRK